MMPPPPFRISVPEAAKLHLALALTAAVFALIAVYSPERFFLAGGAVMLLVAGAAAWLFPWTFFGLAMGSLVLSPENFITIEIGGMDMQSLHKVLILAALGTTIVRHGFVPRMNPPLLAIGLIFATSLTVADLYPMLSEFQIVKTLFGFVVLFLFINVNYDPRAIPRYIKMICFLPIISVVAGVMAQAAQLPSLWGSWQVVVVEYTGAPRLQGINISAFLAYFGLIAVFLCIFEAFRTRKMWFLGLAAVNLVIIILTGTRGPSAAAVLFAALALLLVRQRTFNFSKKLNVALAGIMVLGAVLILYWPAIEARVLSGPDQAVINLSGRQLIWEYFIEAIRVDPWFGRGLGTGAVLLVGRLTVTTAAHNEYLRFLVDGGIFGLSAFILAMVWWIRSELRVMNRDERRITLSFMCAFALYSFTDNTLTSPPSLIAMFALSLLFARARQRLARAGAHHGDTRRRIPARDGPEAARKPRPY